MNEPAGATFHPELVAGVSLPKKPRGPSKKQQAAFDAGYEKAIAEMGGSRMLAFLVWGMGLAVPAFILGYWIG